MSNNNLCESGECELGFNLIDYITTKPIPVRLIFEALGLLLKIVKLVIIIYPVLNLQILLQTGIYTDSSPKTQKFRQKFDLTQKALEFLKIYVDGFLSKFTREREFSTKILVKRTKPLKFQ